MRRAREENGFGLLELLIALVVLNVGILATVAALNSGALALVHADQSATASTLAEQQMERFRGIKYANIEQTTSQWNLAVVDSTWTADRIYQNDMNSPSPPKALIPTVTTCPNTNASTDPNGYSCNPSFVLTGPDGKSFRVDTYMYYDQPTNGGQIKTVTVVVRDANATGAYLARQTSTFDPSTGS